MVRIQDIAKAANVSSATVSRCLRKDPSLSLSSETGKRIYEIALSLGYKNLKTLKKPDEFLVVHKDSHFLDHVDNGYYFSIRSGIEEFIAENGDICRFVPLSRLEMEDHPYTGVLVVGNYPPDEVKRIHSLVKNDNIVFVGKLNFFPECFDTVTYDVEACVRLALDALVSHGMKEMLFLDGKDRCQIPANYLKITHVRNYLLAHPCLILRDFIECEGFGSDAGYQAMSEYLLRNKSVPEAIFTGTDPLAIGVSKALNEHGLQLGSAVHLVSLNGDNSGQWISPPLTTVDFHSKLMGREAARLAKENAKSNERTPKCVYFKPVLLEGKSL
ncbi:MAG: LacI family DNA-binding transcriptional regulator [Sphaerochaetaceae bacterium]